MKRAVFDANILIEFSNSHEGARQVLRNCPGRVISIITWIEFLTGIPEPKLDEAKSFLEDMFDVYYPNEEVYKRCLAIRRERRLKLPDAMIYATAQTLKIPLVTRNTKDFTPALPGIEIPY